MPRCGRCLVVAICCRAALACPARVAADKAPRPVLTSAQVKAAQAQAYVEGAADRAKGTVNNGEL